MFVDMMAGIREDTVSSMFKVELKKAPELDAPKQGELTLSAPSEGGGVKVQKGDQVQESRPAPQRPAAQANLNRAQRRAAAKKPPKTGPGSSFFKTSITFFSISGLVIRFLFHERFVNFYHLTFIYIFQAFETLFINSSKSFKVSSSRFW